MPGDPASGNDDELISQIDELKARMDRLMQGGSSTSNSALLTDEQRPKTPEPPKTVQPAPVDPPVPPGRSRVGDLIKSEDSEIVEVYSGPEAVVPFPADQIPDHRAVSKPTPVAPKPHAPANPKPAVDGSLISVDGGLPQSRPQATTFDDLGDVMQQELAKDASVPPKKGPDLASRFGSSEEPRVVEAAPKPVPEKVAEEPVAEEEDLVEEELEYIEELEEDVYDDPEPSRRSPTGLVAAIWVVTTLTSGAIATLHFTGVF